MITRENIKQLIEENAKEIQKKMDKRGDYMSLYLQIFNAGHYLEVKSEKSYKPKKAQRYADNGMLYIDKHHLMLIIEELGLENLIEY